MVTLTSLPQSVIDQIAATRIDELIEKHEGPWRWGDLLSYLDAEFLDVEGRAVLLPVPRAHHPNITVLRCIVSRDEQILTIFLKDTTDVPDPASEWHSAGYVAICDRWPGHDFYVAHLYHCWFIIQTVIERGSS